MTTRTLGGMTTRTLGGMTTRTLGSMTTRTLGGMTTHTLGSRVGDDTARRSFQNITSLYFRLKYYILFPTYDYYYLD